MDCKLLRGLWWVILSCSCVSPATAQGVTIEEVHRALRQREESISSFHFEWTTRWTLARGGFKNNERVQGSTERLTLPAETTTYDGSGKLVMVGTSKFRLEDERIQFNGKVNKLLPQRTIVVANGEEGKRFYPSGEGIYPRGQISPAPASLLIRDDPFYLPVFMLYRPFFRATSWLDRFEDRYQVASDRVMIDGRACIQVQEKSLQPRQLLITLWLDPERDFVIVRANRSRGEQLILQVSLSDYRKTEDGWVPGSWRHAFLNSEGDVYSSVVATVTKSELNIVPSAETFQFQFPADTWVTDGREGGGKYILKGDGKRRDILKKELVAGATYEQLSNSETGEALQYSSESVQPWLIWGGIGIVCLMSLGLLMVRRIRSKSQGDTP